MKENVLKSFIQDTYKTSSPIPYIITIQVVVFVLIHIFDLIHATGATNIDLYTSSIQLLSLPSQIHAVFYQPWSFISHPFIYTSIFSILFDCLWLYWIGNMFLNFLNNRQLLTVFLGGIFLGAAVYMIFGFFPFFSSQSYLWNTTRFGLAALLSSLCVLIPNTEFRLLIFGNVKLKYITIIYLGLEFCFLIYTNKVAALTYLLMSILGALFMVQLQKGNDWSKVFKNIFLKQQKLKVIKNNTTTTQSFTRSQSDLPNQEIIDQILDKISLNGYESLTSREKEILFKASKQDN